MIAALIRRYPLVVYVAVAFGIAWGGVALVAGLFGPSLFVMFIPMAAGPTAAGLILTGVLDGKQGYRELIARLARWRVAPRWYAVALLLNPLLTLAILGILYFITSPAFAPGIFVTDNPTALVGLALTGGLAAGLFEELGWTGFATPRLLPRSHFAVAGAMLGVVWASWHIGPEFAGASEWGDRLIWRILLWMFAGMIPFRILMTWVYRHTGSVFVAALMHASYTGGQVLLGPINAGQAENLLWWGLLGVGLAMVAGIVIVLDRRGRPIMPSVAASQDEQRRQMPGDGTVQRPILIVTHAIPIDAPPERVWPWIARLPHGLMIAIVQLGHRWMEARHLRGIKRRAERAAQTGVHNAQFA